LTRDAHRVKRADSFARGDCAPRVRDVLFSRASANTDLSPFLLFSLPLRGRRKKPTLRQDFSGRRGRYARVLREFLAADIHHDCIRARIYIPLHLELCRVFTGAGIASAGACGR